MSFAFTFIASQPSRLGHGRHISPGSLCRLQGKSIRVVSSSQPMEREPLIQPVSQFPLYVHAANESSTFSSSDESEQGGASLDSSVHWQTNLRLLEPYLRPATSYLAFLTIASLSSLFLYRGLNLLQPFLTKLILDTLTISKTVPYSLLFYLFVTTCFSHVFDFVCTYSYSIIECDATRRFGIDLYEHLHMLCASFHSNRRVGQLSKIIDRGTDALDTIVDLMIFTLLPTAFEAVFVITIFIRLRLPLIALCNGLCVLLFFAVTFFTTTHTVVARKQVNNVDNQIGDRVVDTLINHETVKSFAMESHEVRVYSRFESVFQRLYTRFRFAVDSQKLFQRLIQSIALVISLLLAGVAVANDSLTPGDFVLIAAYVAQLFGPLATIATSYRLLAQSIIDLDKCVSLLSEESSVKDSPNALQLKFNPNDILAKQAGEIVFDRVCFSYPSSRDGVEKNGLREVTFKVAPGSTVALVGASGVGKSTILRLLLRFYDVSSGAIYIDGHDIRSFSQKSLRQSIGIVSQETALFNQTLRENIAYGRPDADDDEIAEAAEAAALMPLVHSLPLGLDSVVGERGIRLSGGERQRVGCARCILKSPAIVLLDEASSALDTRTEREIQTQLRRVCRNRSTIVVAHRLSTITMADDIVVLGEDERNSWVTVRERGSHRELLDKKGLYASLWAAQTST